MAAERRAIFLSKVLAPPSPTATLTPKTPPESPAIFHYTLPSPGLVSPLALFETSGGNSMHGVPLYASCKPWVEQVDFRFPSYNNCKTLADHKGMPSLDQISARMTFRGRACTLVSGNDSVTRPTRLPAFLTPLHISASHDLRLPCAMDQRKTEPSTQVCFR